MLADQSGETFKREAAAAEAREVLDLALGRLSAEDRLVVTLVHLEGLPVKEAAGDTSARVVITQLQPISVVFPIPEDNLLQVLGPLKSDAHLQVEAYDR